MKSSAQKIQTTSRNSSITCCKFSGSPRMTPAKNSMRHTMVSVASRPFLFSCSLRGSSGQWLHYIHCTASTFLLFLADFTDNAPWWHESRFVTPIKMHIPSTLDSGCMVGLYKKSPWLKDGVSRVCRDR